MTGRGSGIGFVGFRTDGYDAMVALFRDRIGLRTEAAAWCHFRAPDGTVMEIIGPTASPPGGYAAVTIAS